MSKNLENLKKIVEGKSAAIQKDLMLLDDFYSKADPKTQQFIDALLRFHKAIPDKTIKETSVRISIGKIINEQVLYSFLESIVRHPSVMVCDYRKKEPILIVKDENSSIVCFNLTDIEIISCKTNKENGKIRYFFKLHSKHNNLDYSIIITIKEDK